MDKLGQEAIALGYAALQLDTTTRQLAAQAFFQKNGYREVGKGRAKDLEMIYYQKSLMLNYSPASFTRHPFEQLEGVS